MAVKVYKQKVKGKTYYRSRVRKPRPKARAGYTRERKGVRFLVQRINGKTRVQAVLSRTTRYSKAEHIARVKRHRRARSGRRRR